MTSPAPSGLGVKLAEIAAELEWVGKGGFNEAQRYKFVRVEDILDAVRGKLASRGVVLLPSAEDITVTPTVSGKQNITTVRMRYTLMDSATGEAHSVTWIGTGADSGDKGLNKAYTAALKYFFIDLFQIPTGEDPEVETKTKTKAKEPEAALLTAAAVKKVLAAVEEAGLLNKWDLKRTSLGAATDEEMTVAHANLVRDWIDSQPVPA